MPKRSRKRAAGRGPAPRRGGKDAVGKRRTSGLAARTRARRLPPGFRDLEAHLDWALPTERARHAKRMASSMNEIRAFYNVMMKRIDAVLDYLNARPLDGLSAEEKRLLDLALALPEIAPAVELYGEPGNKYWMPLSRFVPTHDVG